jgi:pullulanase
VYWDIALAPGATQLFFIVRNADGSVKNCQSDMPQTIIEKFPFLNGATAFKISQAQLGQVPSLLEDQLVLVKFNRSQAVDATSLQLPGVLDDLFYFDGRLGAHFADGAVQFRLWAPTAQKVRLFVYDFPNGNIPTIYPMTQKELGVWETKAGNYSWVNQKYYLYEVTVFSRSEGQIVTNVVTDPYSLGLAADSVKSLVVDLNSPLTRPFLWNLIPKPPLAGPTDIVLYELHIRDFSISDTNVPAKDRGKYTGTTPLSWQHPS